MKWIKRDIVYRSRFGGLGTEQVPDTVLWLNFPTACVWFQSLWIESCWNSIKAPSPPTPINKYFYTRAHGPLLIATLSTMGQQICTKLIEATAKSDSLQGVRLADKRGSGTLLTDPIPKPQSPHIDGLFLPPGVYNTHPLLPGYH